MKNPLVINLFAGPGVGKSTTAAGIFHNLKLAGYNAEMSREFAKEVVWSERKKTLKDQIYLFGKQHHRLFVLKDDVEVIITDCPLPLGLIYGPQYPQCFRDTVFWAFNEFNNVNVLLNRVKPYNPKGRTQTLEESEEVHKSIVEMLDINNISYINMDGDEKAVEKIVEHVTKLL